MPGVFGLSSGPEAAAKPPGFAVPASVLQDASTKSIKCFPVAYAPPLTLLANITAFLDDA